MEGGLKIQQGQLSCLIASYDQQDGRDLEMILEEDHQDSSSSSFGGSDLSSSSSSSGFLDDDASSPASSQSDNGSLFDLSELMSHLPIKRGLSKFYQGKSQSFTSLARVTSVEDLAKKVAGGGYSQRLKACKSYGGDLNLNMNKHKSSTIKSPKSTISKRSYSSSCLKSKIRNVGFTITSIDGGKPPISTLQV